jgi:streptogramin lyase
MISIALSWSQNENLAINEWRALIPFQQGSYVAQTKKDIIYVSERGLLLIDKEDSSLDYLSKNDGLSESTPRLVSYSEELNALVVAYENSNLDIILEDRIIVAPFIEESDNITGSKQINNLVYIDSILYILADFGVVQFDAAKLEVITTLITDFPIYDIEAFAGNIFIAGSNGIYYNDKDASDLEFSFFDVWSPLDHLPGQTGIFTRALSKNESYLFVANNNEALERYDRQLQRDSIAVFPGKYQRFIGPDNEKGILFTLCDQEETEKCRGEVMNWSSDGGFQGLDQDCIGRPINVLQDEQGNVWLSDEWSEYRYWNGINGPCNKFLTNTPRDDQAFDIAFGPNGELWIAGGIYELSNVTGKFVFPFTTFLNYSDGEWDYTSWEQDELLNENTLAMMCRVARDPGTGKVYFASFIDGLLEIDGEIRTVYNHIDDHLGDDVLVENRTKVFDVEVAPNGDVWVSNFRNNFPIRVKRADGQWEKYGALGATNLTDLVIDDNGNKWYIDAGSNNGLIVFNDNNTEDPTDDQIRRINTSNSVMTTNETTFIEKDLDGSIWVGTASGVYIFDCGGGAFESFCDGFRPVIQVDGLPENLLNDERVTAINIDGGNRVWLGTTNGIFVHSGDDFSEIAHYNIDNSPLLSNEIASISINQKSGEVYIGTTQGLNLLQTEARQGELFHASEIEVYPNPVRPGYTGPIAINGFAQDSDIKITDINGRLVYQTESIGGQAIWYGLDGNGSKVKAGVYFVFGATQDINNTEGAVAKILFIP